MIKAKMKKKRLLTQVKNNRKSTKTKSS